MIHESRLRWLALIYWLAACGGPTSGGGPGAGGASDQDGAASAESDRPATTCEYKGSTYSLGETFPVGDPCNVCTCYETGVYCGQSDCYYPCTYGGKTYQPYETFPAEDGCNTCHCSYPPGGGYAVCTQNVCDECVYDGQSYKLGESWLATDGCDKYCTCNSGGSISCTEKNCITVCTYAGKEYSPGESFASLDGCNECTCVETTKTPGSCECLAGTASCTEKACPCHAKKEWWREYVATGLHGCATIDYTCPDNTNPFSNQCGCGCEQHSSCPKIFDCVPPASCDVNAIKQKCPFSGIVL